MVSVLYPETGDQPTALPAVPLQRRAVSCRCDAESWTCPGEEILVVRMSGEFDLLTGPDLTVALRDALSRGPRHRVIDLAATTSCCLRGYELLAATASAAGARGIRFALSRLTIHQDKVLSLILPDPGPVRHRSVAAAVATICADQPPPSPWCVPGVGQQNGNPTAADDHHRRVAGSDVS